MGGRGSSSSKANGRSTRSAGSTDRVSPETKPQVTSKKSVKPVTLKSAKDIPNFIKNQTGIDINKYRDDTTRRFDKRSYINIDWSSMPASARRSLELLSRANYSTNIQLEDQGAWMKAIRIKKK